MSELNTRCNRWFGLMIEVEKSEGNEVGCGEVMVAVGGGG
jgi:hypothetical protein